MKNKIIAVLMILVLTLSFSCISLASSTNKVQSEYVKITTKDVLNTIGDSSLKLSFDFSNDKIDGISLNKAGVQVSAKMSITKNILYISPSKYLEGEATYTIKIFTRSNKKYSLELVAIDTFDYDTHDKFLTAKFNDPYFDTPSGNRILEIAPKPSKGFNYPYLLLIPKGVTQSKGTKYMVVEPNNSGFTSDSLKYHEDLARATAHANGPISGGAGGYQVATELNTPLLVPIFPRPNTDDGAGIYIQALDRETILIKDGDMKRVDIQLIAMIEDARSILSQRGIIIEKKVLMTGFSASGDFVNRFMFLHPEYVKAITSSTSTIFPAASYKGVTLNYPLGIADMKELTGIEFNVKEYAKIPKYIYTGELDRNDGVTEDGDKNGEQYVKAMRTLFGQELFPDKWNKKIQIIDELGYGNKYQYHIYKNIGHSSSPKIYQDIVSFMKANLGDTFSKITPHESAW